LTLPGTQKSQPGENPRAITVGEVGEIRTEEEEGATNPASDVSVLPGRCLSNLWGWV
jgi:hypothetical protein